MVKISGWNQPNSKSEGFIVEWSETWIIDPHFQQYIQQEGIIHTILGSTLWKKLTSGTQKICWFGLWTLWLSLFETGWCSGSMLIFRGLYWVIVILRCWKERQLPIHNVHTLAKAENPHLTNQFGVVTTCLDGLMFTLFLGSETVKLGSKTPRQTYTAWSNYIITISYVEICNCFNWSYIHDSVYTYIYLSLYFQYVH